MDSMKIAIMQPYFFPYMGYFQLVKAVDLFVVLDDVNFIKRGWIHRNQLVFNNSSKLFSIPLENASQFRLINEIKIAETQFSGFRENLIKSIKQFYARERFLNTGLTMLEDALTAGKHISAMAVRSIEIVCRQLEISTLITLSSSLPGMTAWKKERRLIEICKFFGADTYINPPGGKELYHHSVFEEYGLDLQFIKPSIVPYKSSSHDFFPALSVLDAIMCVGPDYAASTLLPYFELEAAK